MHQETAGIAVLETHLTKSRQLQHRFQRIRARTKVRPRRDRLKRPRVAKTEHPTDRQATTRRRGKGSAVWARS